VGSEVMQSSRAIVGFLTAFAINFEWNDLQVVG
jgi:hypothetical protein